VRSGRSYGLSLGLGATIGGHRRTKGLNWASLVRARHALLMSSGIELGYRTSPSASALRALNAATQSGKSLNILGIVPPFAVRTELP
jgi:hypothetical protein